MLAGPVASVAFMHLSSASAAAPTRLPPLPPPRRRRPTATRASLRSSFSACVPLLHGVYSLKPCAGYTRYVCLRHMVMVMVAVTVMRWWIWRRPAAPSHPRAVRARFPNAPFGPREDDHGHDARRDEARRSGLRSVSVSLPHTCPLFSSRCSGTMKKKD